MAIDVKVNFFFSQDVNGWSETYYTNAQDLDAAFQQAKALAVVRATLMADPCKLKYIRVARLGGNGESTLTFVGPGSASNITAPQTWVSNAGEVQDAMVLTLYASSVTKSRKVYLHGFPDNALDLANQQNQDAQAFLTALSNFQAAFGAAPWSIRYHPRRDQTSPQIITAMAPSANEKQTDVTLDNPIAGLVEQDYVELYLIKGVPGRPGIQRVLKIDATDKIITIGYTLPSGFEYADGGMMSKYVPALAPITSSNVRGFSSHKVGRPFGISAGRRRSIHL